MTNPAYEATNSGVEKLIADMKDSAEKATPGEWHLSNEHKLIIRDEDHLHIANAGYFDNPVEVADAKHIALANPKNVLALIAALEQAHQENKEQSARIEELESQRQLAFMACNRWRDKCADAEKRIAELESAPNGMMQPSNELAEMKRNKLVVKLPAACADDEYFIDGVFQPMRYERDIERAIIAAGGTVEGE